jgi:hypothetical protein
VYDGTVPVDAEQVRELCEKLPRSTQHWVRGREKFKVGRLVYLTFSEDESLIGFGFPREQREAVVEAEPEKFLMPRPADLRYQWLVARLEALDLAEMTELVTDAWAMCVPKSVARAHFSPEADGPTGSGSGADQPA